MRLSFLIALRYLLGKKSTNAINIITGISIVGITIGTAVLFLILCVFNGFESLIGGFFNAANPEIKIYPASGKTIDSNAFPWTFLDQLDGIEGYSKTLEELVLFEHDGIQEVGFLKGVDSNFVRVNAVNKSMRSGHFVLDDGQRDFAVLGYGLSNKLNLNMYRNLVPFKIYAPQKKQSIIPGKPYKSMLVYPSGTFALQSEQDHNLAFTSLAFVQNLFGDTNKLSFVELKVKETNTISNVKAALVEKLADDYVVKDQREQDSSTMRVLEIEKWMSYAIACFTLLLIAFNMVGALWMIVLEKQKDIAILKAMGMAKNDVQRIFIYEGVLIALIGFVLGMIIGLILYYLQTEYGLVPIPEGAIIDAYPAQARWIDVVVVFFTVLIIGFVASLLPAKRAGQIQSTLREN